MWTLMTRKREYLTVETSITPRGARAGPFLLAAGPFQPYTPLLSLPLPPFASSLRLLSSSLDRSLLAIEPVPQSVLPSSTLCFIFLCFPLLFRRILNPCPLGVILLAHRLYAVRLLDLDPKITRAALVLRCLMAIREEPFEGLPDGVCIPIALALVQIVCWRLLAESGQEHGYLNC